MCKLLSCAGYGVQRYVVQPYLIQNVTLYPSKRIWVASVFLSPLTDRVGRSGLKSTTLRVILNITSQHRGGSRYVRRDAVLLVVENKGFDACEFADSHIAGGTGQNVVGILVHANWVF